MDNLTDSKYWDQYWNDVKLPIIVDVQNDPYAQTLDRLFQTYLGRGQKKFIEVGCGSSKWLIYFQQNFGYRVYGIDSSEKACDISRRNLSAMGIHGEIICEDIFNTSFREGNFDILFSGGLIEHFKNPVAILQKMATLLAPGGYLITSVPNIASIYWLFQKVIDRKVYQQHFKISTGELTNFYQQIGLTLDIIRYVGAFDLFSIDWSLMQSRSRIWREIGMPLIGNFNSVINYILKTFSIAFESKLFSPFIIAIGHKT